MAENLRVIGGHITISRQLLEQSIAGEKAFDDVRAGRVKWNEPDWDEWQRWDESRDD